MSENLSAVNVIISASVARSGISQDAVSVAFGTTVLINEASIYFALSESSLSAILNLSAHTKFDFSVSKAGESWLGSTAFFAPVSHVSVSDAICAFVGISTLPATVVLAFGVTVPVSSASHCADHRL